MCELLPCCLALTSNSSSSNNNNSSVGAKTEATTTISEDGDFIDLAEALSEDFMFTLRKAFGSTPQLDTSGSGELCSESEISSQTSSI